MQQSPSDVSVYLAIYGALKSAHQSHDMVLKAAKYLGEYTTPKAFSLYQYGNEPAVLNGGNQSITIDVFEITPEQLEQIDDFEHYPTVHDRITINIPGFGPALLYVMSEGYAGLAHVYDSPYRQAEEKQPVAV
ncbi:gamma-glutamylcyclotransferase [Celerinatantimonas sp. YJH-8]|uniref:gamma-glutamylcyclotransferase family protein n=1 Tax=Celerinatantimonas sp. YJH-8 TaxID=3228714 RepID=UPI0038C3687F